MIIARHLVGLEAWLDPVSLAVLHGMLVAGIFAGNVTAISTAAYLEYWPVTEFVSLILILGRGVRPNIVLTVA